MNIFATHLSECDACIMWLYHSISSQSKLATCTIDLPLPCMKWIHVLSSYPCLESITRCINFLPLLTLNRILNLLFTSTKIGSYTHRHLTFLHPSVVDRILYVTVRYLWNCSVFFQRQWNTLLCQQSDVIDMYHRSTPCYSKILYCTED
jgi:hypothetical protein